jgi:ATP-dependent DNA ligase
MYVLNNGKIIDDETGEIIVKDTSSKFQDWYYDDYVREFKETKEIRFLEPMTAKELKDGEEIPQEGWIAEEKFDGHRATCYLTSKGMRLFSRRISKKTGWYSENTDSLPHIRECNPGKVMLGSILDGEIIMPTGVFADVQGVTGALPDRALQNQGEKGFAVLRAFDILYYRGINIQAMPLFKRKEYLQLVVCELASPFITIVPWWDGSQVDFKKVLEQVWERGGEGLILKDINARYEQKRSYFFLKLKDCIYRDVVVMDYEPPTKYFDGKTLDDKWRYWYSPESDSCIEHLGDPSSGVQQFDAVTKPFCKGWVGAITCGVYQNGKLVPVVSLKGFTDEEQDYIKQNRAELKGAVLEVKGQGISDRLKGTIRHPRFSRWRPDKDAEQCKWSDHIL